MADVSFNVASTVAAGLASYYEEVQAKVHEWVAPVSSEQLWRKPYRYGNSIGHLLLHLTGNLNYYIGARIAETGYVRDRDREFNDTVKKSKEEVLADFDRAISMVVATIQRQSPRRLDRPIPRRSASLIPKIASPLFFDAPRMPTTTLVRSSI